MRRFSKLNALLVLVPLLLPILAQAQVPRTVVTELFSTTW